MKTIITFAVAGVLLASIFGCAPKSGRFGEPITEGAITPIGDILAHPEQFQKQPVKVAGKITDECPAGGWFFLQDETGLIYVNLHPSYFAIPQAVGRKAVAQGVVRKEGPQIEVIAKGVELP